MPGFLAIAIRNDRQMTKSEKVYKKQKGMV